MANLELAMVVREESAFQRFLISTFNKATTLLSAHRKKTAETNAWSCLAESRAEVDRALTEDQPHLVLSIEPVDSNERDAMCQSSLTTLPDDVVDMCLRSLDAQDLVAMESVNSRFRELVFLNSRLWRDLVIARWARWGLAANHRIIESAAHFAGSWKNLYAEKTVSERRLKPWVMPTKSEVDAILEIIRDGNPMLLSGSPTSVMYVSQPMTPMHDVSVLLLLDGSSSVTREDFEAMKNFARSLVVSLRECDRTSYVGLIQFNQTPRTIIPMRRADDENLLETVDRMQQLMGSTDIAAPIRSAIDILTEHSAEYSDKVVLLMSDGQTSTAELAMAQTEARRAAEQLGARLFTFGVGRDVDEIGLHRIATSTRVEKPGNGIFYPEDSGGSYFTLRRMERSLL